MSDLNNKILVADDEEINLILMSKILEKNGYQSHCVRDGQEVLSAVDESPSLPLCILIDLMMPNLSGWEATTLLRQNSKTAKIPIIATTALSRSEEEGVDDEFDFYCVKPISEKTLIQAIKSCIADKHS